MSTGDRNLIQKQNLHPAFSDNKETLLSSKTQNTREKVIGRSQKHCIEPAFLAQIYHPYVQTNFPALEHRLSGL